MQNKPEIFSLNFVHLRGETQFLTLSLRRINDGCILASCHTKYSHLVGSCRSMILCRCNCHTAKRYVYPWQANSYIHYCGRSNYYCNGERCVLMLQTSATYGPGSLTAASSTYSSTSPGTCDRWARRSSTC